MDIKMVGMQVDSLLLLADKFERQAQDLRVAARSISSSIEPDPTAEEVAENLRCTELHRKQMEECNKWEKDNPWDYVSPEKRDYVFIDHEHCFFYYAEITGEQYGELLKVHKENITTVDVSFSSYWCKRNNQMLSDLGYETDFVKRKTNSGCGFMKRED